MSTGPAASQSGTEGGAPVRLSLALLPERTLIRPSASYRHIVFQVRVPSAPAVVAARMPLRLALVLDRSGSMAGDKLPTAKRAAQAVVDRLNEQDEVAVVVFDDRIDIVQPASPATPEAKARIRTALRHIEARGSTALHEGWLTGCNAIVRDQAPQENPALARCLLLTDGLANVGETDPERIATEAAGIREHAGIGTSTYGIGDNYDETLLGPMAVAGGGQMHHLRTAEEIARTFSGELSELFAVVARQVRLEVQAGAGVEPEMVSEYRMASSGAGVWPATLGDLIAGEERYVVVRFTFPDRGASPDCAVRARLVWSSGAAEQATDWCQVRFAYAGDSACAAEPRDPAAMHWVGLHHAERAMRVATQLNRQGDLAGARDLLRRVAGHIAEYAGDDPDLQAKLQELRSFEAEASSAVLPSATLKEAYFQTSRRSRGQRDLRR